MEFKTKGSTSQVEGVKFSKNGYSFSGSKIDKQFSYSKNDFALRQNSQAEQQSLPPIQSCLPMQPVPNHPQLTAEQTGSVTGGLFDLQILPNGTDPEEEAFCRQMQKTKKRPQIRM